MTAGLCGFLNDAKFNICQNLRVCAGFKMGLKNIYINCGFVQVFLCPFFGKINRLRVCAGFFMPLFWKNKQVAGLCRFSILAKTRSNLASNFKFAASLRNKNPQQI
jgi:hypothetical protein